MTYHTERPQLRCHICDSRAELPETCPQCFKRSIRFMGLGTQRLEQEVAAAFPQARTQRWDRDVTEGKGAHEKVLRSFLNHEADILIGTQMLAKGLHLPGVTLVGVVNADIGLHIPDFRAHEHAFQILCQVAGRSGRGPAGGKVVIQTYSPDDYAIKAAALQDYRLFYGQEIARRAELTLPPFTRLARLVYQHTDARKASGEAARVHAELVRTQRQQGYPNTRFIGPAPALYERIRGRYRWHIVIKSPEPQLLLEALYLPEGWTIDIDPVQLL